MKNSRSNLINIILDLDSTVINSLRPWEKQPRGLVSYEMKDEDEDQVEFIVYERPHLQEFLDYIFKNYTVAVWTAASKDYAIFIIEKILLQNKPERKLDLFLFDFHGELCENKKIGNIPCKSPKDLELVYKAFPRFNKDNTIIIDDYEAVYMPQMGNAYPIPPFNADEPDAKDDTELLKLMRKLSRESTEGTESTGGTESKNFPTDNLITKVTLKKALAKAKAENYS